jgi:signal transduction histidine kinase
MVGMNPPTGTSAAGSWSRPQSSDLAASACQWQQDLHQAGVHIPQVAVTFRAGIPALVLAMIGGAAVAAVAAPGSASAYPAYPAPLGLGLLVAAALPWVRWLVHGDDGPTWLFAFLVLTPLAGLGVGQWFVGAMSLGSDLAYLMVALPDLLLVVLVAAFAARRLAVGAAVAGYLAYGAPLVAGWIATPNVTTTAVLIWHLSFAFCVATGSAVRFSSFVSRKLVEAREAMALQAAAEQRRQAAQDVHDVVAHTLAITMLHITAARMAVRRSSPDEAVEALEEAERHGRASLADIRRIVRLLRADDATAVDAAQPGLADVETLADSYRAAGVAVELSLAVDGNAVSPTAELAVYRVLQEALANAARHGRGPATVDLRVSDGAVSLDVGNPVADDGSNGRRPARRVPGSGLIGMRERISAAGGSIEAGAQDGRWVVRARVPGGAGA